MTTQSARRTASRYGGLGFIRCGESLGSTHPGLIVQPVPQPGITSSPSIWTERPLSGILDEVGARSIGHLECETPGSFPSFTHLDVTTAM